MPIDKNTFVIAKDPSPLILNFLAHHQEEAFTAEEIIMGIDIIQELLIPNRRIKENLDMLVRNGKIQIAWVKADSYYMIVPGKF